MSDCVVPAGKNITEAKCHKNLTFSVIGSDSSLFHTPIHNISKITLASAERFELLIIFDGDNGKDIVNPIGKDEKYIILVSDGTNDTNINKVRQFWEIAPHKTTNKYKKFPSELK